MKAPTLPLVSIGLAMLIATAWPGGSWELQVAGDALRTGAMVTIWIPIGIVAPRILPGQLTEGRRGMAVLTALVLNTAAVYIIHLGGLLIPATIGITAILSIGAGTTAWGASLPSQPKPAPTPMEAAPSQAPAASARSGHVDTMVLAGIFLVLHLIMLFRGEVAWLLDWWLPELVGFILIIGGWLLAAALAAALVRNEAHRLALAAMLAIAFHALGGAMTIIGEVIGYGPWAMHLPGPIRFLLMPLLAAVVAVGLSQGPYRPRVAASVA